MNPATLLSILPVLGILLGLTRVKYPRVPWLAAALLSGVFALYLLAMASWAASCWDCTGANETRGEILAVSGIYFGIIVGTTLLGLWLGTRLTVVLGRLVRTVAELRGRE